MAKLRVLDKVGLGELIIKAAQDVGGARQRLVDDPIGTLRKFGETLDQEGRIALVKRRQRLHRLGGIIEALRLKRRWRGYVEWR